MFVSLYPLSFFLSFLAAVQQGLDCLVIIVDAGLLTCMRISIPGSILLYSKCASNMVHATIPPCLIHYPFRCPFCHSFLPFFPSHSSSLPSSLSLLSSLLHTPFLPHASVSLLPLPLLPPPLFSPPSFLLPLSPSLLSPPSFPLPPFLTHFFLSYCPSPPFLSLDPPPPLSSSHPHLLLPPSLT